MPSIEEPVLREGVRGLVLIAEKKYEASAGQCISRIIPHRLSLQFFSMNNFSFSFNFNFNFNFNGERSNDSQGRQSRKIVKEDSQGR